MKLKNTRHLFRAALSMVFVLLLMIPFGKIIAADDDASEEPVSVNTRETDDDPGMNVAKTVTVLENGTYIVNLEAFATGEVEFSTKIVPVDLVLVLDVSGSMRYDINEYGYTGRQSQAYSYNGYGYNTYYYKHTDGNYYQVSRGTHYNSSGRARYHLSYTVGSTTYYLSGTGTTTTAPNNINNGGSTIWTGVLYTRTVVSSQPKIEALQTAVNNFIDVVAEKNQEVLDKNADAPASDLSRVGIVKLAYEKYNTSYDDYAEGDHKDSSGYNYTEVFKDLTVVKQVDLDTANTGWHAKVNSLTAAGATAADYAMGYAEAMYNRHKNDFDDRQTVIVMFTDGEPNHNSGFSNSVARDTINTSKNLKAQNVKVFTVAVLEGSDPSIDPVNGSYANNDIKKINQYLHAVSSNYKNADAGTSGFNVSFGSRTVKEDGTNEDYYFSASSADELDKIFTAIAQSSASTSSQVGAQSVMKDIVSSSFTLPEGANTDDIIVKIVPWDSTIHNWSTTTNYSIGQWADQTDAKNYEAKGKESVSVVISEDGKTIDITGFDYSTHFQATNNPDDDHDGANKQTAKIVISFPIQAKPSSVTGGSVATNGEASGIYLTADSEEAIIKFPVPEVTFTPVTYVVDYVTSDTTTDTKASTVKLDYSGVLKNVEMLDDPSDDYLIGEKATDFDYIIYTGDYGTISYGDNATDVQRRYVRYAPTTMDWSGYDRIFIKGKSATDHNLDVWAMLCVIPANSVFYEDTFISLEKNVVYNEQPATIVYTGINYDSSWSGVGTEGTNQTYHAGDDMGWVTGLADDTTYANDMAHMSNTAAATATFTFSGTGMDIYSRTNGSTGRILVSVKSLAADNVSNKTVSKLKNIDTKAASGDFFAVPVCTFTDLPYGKYTATIKVTSGASSENRMTFYLDGIRVYNPIKPLEGDGNVQMMYGEKNMGAVFTEVRSMLSTDAIASALYIDEHTTSEVVTDVEAIEEAARELSAAQLDRDNFVEQTFAPAKNAYNKAQAALESAAAAVTAAANVYEVAEDAYYDALAAANGNTEDPAVVAAKAVMDETERKLNLAVEAENNLKAEYNEEKMAELYNNLTDAQTELNEKEAVIVEKRKAYDKVNDGVVLNYTTDNIAEYNKEGPKSEVLLSAGEQVAINVESGKYYYIGLNSLKGNNVKVLINGKAVTVNETEGLSHTADLYYECTPENNGETIVIKNNSEKESDAVLSVTKLRTTGIDNTTNGAKFASSEETLSYVRNLAKQAVSDYNGEVLTEEEIKPEETETEEETVSVIDESEISIESEETTNTDPVNEGEDEQETENSDSTASIIYRLMFSFLRFFRP